MSIPEVPTDNLSYSSLRQGLVILFVISTVAFILLMGLGGNGPGVKTATATPTRHLDRLTPTPGPGTSTPPEPSDGDQGGSSPTLLTWISFVTAVTSLLGVVSTTYLGWRKETRETQAAERERQRHELEMERLRRELGGAEEDLGPKEES